MVIVVGLVDASLDLFLDDLIWRPVQIVQLIHLNNNQSPSMD